MLLTCLGEKWRGQWNAFVASYVRVGKESERKIQLPGLSKKALCKCLSGVVNLLSILGCHCIRKPDVERL